MWLFSQYLTWTGCKNHSWDPLVVGDETFQVVIHVHTMTCRHVLHLGKYSTGEKGGARVQTAVHS